MSYPTILVHVDDSRHVQQCIDIAARNALADNAHLIGVANTGIHTPLYPAGIADLPLLSLTTSIELVQERINRGLSVFDAAMQRIGVASFEKRIIDGESREAMSMLARHCDLTVLGQSDPDNPAPLVPSDFPEYVVMHCARPVLVVPCAGQFETVGRRPLVAWDASTSSARAIANAISLLRHAERTELVMFNPEKHGGPHARQSQIDIALYLARHDIKATVSERSSNGPVGPALLKMAAELGADTIVMGAYGHRRFREILLGGVTRCILRAMTVPVLMSH